MSVVGATQSGPGLCPNEGPGLRPYSTIINCPEEGDMDQF
jgi:hypothetical protein